MRGVPASAPRGPPPVPRKRPTRRRRPSHDPSGRGGLRVGARIARRDRRPAGLAVRASTPHTPGTSTPHTPGISIEIPSVKRHSVSSPVRCFLRLLYGRVQLSLRPSRCCAASVRAVGWDAMVPAHVGDTKERTAPIIQRLSNDFDVVRPNSRNFSRSPLPIRSTRFAHGAALLSRAFVFGLRPRPTLLRVVRDAVPPHRARTPARRRASATTAIRLPRRWVMVSVHARSAAVAGDFACRICHATSTGSRRIRPLHALVIRPCRRFSPELRSLGTTPR